VVINYLKRIRKVREEIAARHLDALLVTCETNVSYLSGFKGHDSLILITPDKEFFITDSRYIEDAALSIKGFDIRQVRLSTYSTIKELVRKYRVKRLGFESMDLPYEVATRFKRLLSSVRIVGVKNLIEGLRAVKDDDEIKLIRSSIRLTKEVFRKAVDLVRPGESEISIAQKAEMEFISRCARPSFELIVSADARSSRPHAAPTDAKVGRNSFLMIDIGCIFDGYCSDMTRMVIVGKVKDRFKKIYNVVREAQRKAIDLIKPGERIAEIDLAARNYIKGKGFGKYFGHALGHGVGMRVHEAPGISRLNEEPLKPGMVFTVEPAIYVPGFGGVRIEDMVLVKRNGCEILTA
jgi:Xaa-Pro aminopeptidase